MKEYIERERYYSESLLRSLAYEDDVNGNCDGMIDFTVIDSISGADVAPVVHGEWIETENKYSFQCSSCKAVKLLKDKYCGNCGAIMDGGK